MFTELYMKQQAGKNTPSYLRNTALPHGAAGLGCKSRTTLNQQQKMNASKIKSERTSRRFLDTGPKRYFNRPQSTQRCNRKITQPVVFTPPVVYSPQHSPQIVRSKKTTLSHFKPTPSSRLPTVVQQRGSYNLHPSTTGNVTSPKKRSSTSIARKLSSPQISVGNAELDTAMGALSMNSSYSYVYSQPSGMLINIHSLYCLFHMCV